MNIRRHKFRLTKPIFDAVFQGERYFVVMPASSGIQRGDELHLIEADFKLNSIPGARNLNTIVTHVSSERQRDNVVVGFLMAEEVDSLRLYNHLESEA